MDDLEPTENFHEKKKSQSTKTKMQSRKRANNGTFDVCGPENDVNKRERHAPSSETKPIRRTSLRLSQKIEKNVAEPSSSAPSERRDARSSRDRTEDEVAPSEKITPAKEENTRSEFTAEKKDMENLLSRLKEMKGRRAIGSEKGVRYHPKDEEISMDEFDKSMRALDTACGSQEPLKMQIDRTPSNLGLVSFQVFQSLSNPPTDDKPPDNPRTITHLSFDEDNEEDMFADASEDTEKISQSDRKIQGESSPPFRGFTSSESERSQSIAASYGKIETLRKLESSDEEDQLSEDSARKKTGTNEGDRLEVQCLPRIRELRNLEYPRSRDKKTFGDSTTEVRSLPYDAAHSPEPVGSMAKNSCPPCGFSTAGGRPIAVSDAAIARAQRIYKEIEVVEREREISSSEVVQKSLDGGNAEVKNQIGSDGEIKPKNYISSSAAVERRETSWKASASTAQILFDETEDAIFENLIEPNPAAKDDTIGEVGATNISSKAVEAKKAVGLGFTTARGGELKISERSLSRAQALFDEIAMESTATARQDCGEKFAPAINERANIDEKKNEIRAGFSTARGDHLKISGEALSKAKAQFDEIKDQSNLNVTPPNPRISDRPKKASVAFKTAGGRELRISNEALAKAKAQYRAVENESIKLPPESDANIVAVLPHIPSFDQQKIVQPSNLESLDLEDFTIDEATAKRKFEDVDDDTPLRREPPWKRKKGRHVNDLQGRKLFEDNAASISTLGETEADPSEQEKPSSTDEPRKTRISDEIDASAAALMEDEELFMEITRKESSPRSNDVTPSAASKEYESIPDDLTFDSQFSQDHHHAQIIDNFIVETMKVMEARLVMTSKQNETIRAKTRVKPRASDGSLYRSRTTKRESRFSWRELTQGESPVPRQNSEIHVDSDILSVTASTAASYSFSCADFYGGKNVRVNVEGINVGDGAFLILDDRNCAGAREFEGAFLASPGVDPNLVPAGWVKNHYRWIVWKLASMDRVKFGQKCLPRMLTPNRVMLELKYRYDREIYRTQWPPLRRILEKNEDAAPRLVLCVASISFQDENKTVATGSSNTPGAHPATAYRITLTDGWYSIPASIDLAMVNCIKSGKVKEGTKLVTFGAKAMNLDQGCSVLEIPACVTLRIHTNSTRRAKWDTKLDFWRPNRGPMSLSLKSIKSNGGAIGKLVVAVARSYPVLYREKLADGQFVFRNARSDEEAARAHEARYQARMEEICERARTEFQFDSQSSSVNRAAEIKRKIASELNECLPPPRDVTPVLKVRLAENDTSAMMTIWFTGRETDQVFDEGSTLVIYNSFASGQRCNELQITAGRNTIFSTDTSQRISYPERICTPLSDIGEIGFNPAYGEFDTVGIVASIGPAPHGMKNFETVNFACPRSEDEKVSDFLSVLFWQGVSSHGYSKILTVGALVACSNLEWRRNTPRIVPTAYCTERTIFTKNPRQKHLVKPFENLLESTKNSLSYATNCAALIQEEVSKKTPSRGTPGTGTPYRGATCSQTTTGWSPREPGTSGDVNSTPKNNSRKASIMRRIEKLEAYGEPPKLPAISINHSSPKVLSDFRSPVFTPVTKS